MIRISYFWFIKITMKGEFMKKRELIIFLVLEVISGFFLGVYFGFFLQQFAKVSCEISFVFLFAGLSINLVNVLVYHKKYENLIKSLNNN